MQLTANQKEKVSRVLATANNCIITINHSVGKMKKEKINRIVRVSSNSRVIVLALSFLYHRDKEAILLWTAGIIPLELYSTSSVSYQAE